MIRIRALGNSLVAALTALLVCAAMACGGDKPAARLPTTAARDRMAARVELVNLVISDAERAAKVRALYIAMDSLLIEAKRAQAQQLLLLGGERPASDEEMRARLSAVRQAEANALDHYIELQLELRRFTTADEFARLDAIR